MQRAELEALGRDALVSRAEAAGVPRARVLTRPELIDELIVRVGPSDTEARRRARGFLGRARDLLARVVERGLHLPDAANRIRSVPPPAPAQRAPSVVPTVTLAEIYATQGHRAKALETLRAVLAQEPEHAAAQALMAQLQSPGYVAPKPALPPEASGADELGGSSHMESEPEGGSREPPEPARMLDADPLPPRYDVDECVAMSVDPRTVYVYWELRDDTIARLRKVAGGGHVSLRVLAIVPGWDGPRTVTRDIEVGGAQLGDWFVRDLPKDAIVRAAIGWVMPDGVFLSAAHSLPAEPAPVDQAGILAELLARWTREGSSPVGASDAEAAAFARALARSEARRVAEERVQAVRAGRADELGIAPQAPLGASERMGPMGASERFAPSSWGAPR